jgi:hypothetical protein
MRGLIPGFDDRSLQSPKNEPVRYALVRRRVAQQTSESVRPRVSAMGPYSTTARILLGAAALVLSGSASYFYLSATESPAGRRLLVLSCSVLVTAVLLRAAITGRWGASAGSRGSTRLKR